MNDYKAELEDAEVTPDMVLACDIDLSGYTGQMDIDLFTAAVIADEIGQKITKCKYDNVTFVISI